MAISNLTTIPPVVNPLDDTEPPVLRSRPMSYRIKNWARFQHFKDRKPPWIKLYRDLLDDLEWHKLDGGSAKMLTALWLIASERGGDLPDVATIAFRVRLPEKQVKSTISNLSHWVLRIDDSAISPRCHDDPLETETETETEGETETEERPRKRGSRLPDDWQPGAEDIRYATEHGLDFARVAEVFRNYWHAAAGKGAVKLDWSATWRNWVLRDAKDVPRKPADKPVPTTAQIQAERAKAAGQNRAVAEKLGLPKLRP